MSTPDADSTTDADRRVRLEAYLRRQGRDIAVTSWRPLSGGRSTQTIRVGMLDGSDELDCVLHFEPAAGPLAGRSSAGRQFSVLEALAATPVPAPRPRWLCSDPHVLGRAFFLTDLIPGDVPTPWRVEGRAFLDQHEPGGELAESFLRTLVDVHTVPVGTLPPELGGGDERAAASHAERERARWAAVVADSPSFADDPVLAYADAWLASRRPPASAPALVHGDYRIGNVVLDGPRVVGVLDWELAEVGDPVFDVATLCAPPLRTRGLAGGLWRDEALIIRYEQLSGRRVDRKALHHYRVLATYKIVCLWVNASRDFSAGRMDLASLRAGYSVVAARAMLAEVLGLPAAPATEANLADPAARAAATLHDSLSQDVLPSVVDDGARERLRGVIAVLRSQRVAPARGLADEFARRVDELARELAAISPVAAALEPRLAPDVRLGRLVHALMGVPALARAVGHPTHARLRQAVAMAAVPSLGRWP